MSVNDVGLESLTPGRAFELFGAMRRDLGFTPIGAALECDGPSPPVPRFVVDPLAQCENFKGSACEPPR